MKNYNARMKKGVLLTSISRFIGNDRKKEIDKQKAAALSYCKKNDIIPIRYFNENHLGNNLERPILKTLKRFLHNNNHDIEIVVFPGFKIFENDEQIIQFIMELSYLNIQLSSFDE